MRLINEIAEKRGSMNTNALEKFAQSARRQLLDQVSTRLGRDLVVRIRKRHQPSPQE